MKTIWVVIGMILFSLKVWAQQITFSETFYDLGTIGLEDSVAYHDFYFMNTGERPLLIKDVWVSCGCMAGEYPRGAIQSGEKACIRLSYFRGQRHEESFLKMAEVTTNAGVVELRIAGNVIRSKQKVSPDYQLKPEDGCMPDKQQGQQDVYTQIMERMRMEMLRKPDVAKNDSLTLAGVATLRRGGYWPEIDYRCYSRQDWEPVGHLDRLRPLVLSYVSPGRYCGNDSLYTAIRDALAYWVKMSPKCHNWWYNEIAVPQKLGDILVLLDIGRKRLPDSLQNDLFRMMSWPDPRKWTGANKQDIALHHLQRGCLLKNDSIVRASVDELFYPVRITTREGVQADLSYQQHGNQLYIGGYGTVFVGCVMRVAEWVMNTPYALQNEQLQLFSEFMRHTYLNVFRGSYIDFSVLGRGISRQGAQHYGDMAGVLQKMMHLDPLHAREYAQAIPRFEGHADSCRTDCSWVFWRSDYALHNRKTYDFSVRTSSIRSQKIEYGNGENLKGGLLSDGATSVRINGDEYFDLFPYWDWNQVPGVTAPEKAPLKPAAWGKKGKAVFSGGASDGKYSVMAYVINDYKIKARKAWFMFDKEIVCLGTDIWGEGAGKVQTTVEQCRGKAEMQQEKNAMLHNRILYYFPQQDTFYVENKPVQASWFTININYTDDHGHPDRRFKLWLDHGDDPQGAKYAYFIVPDVKKITDYNAGNIEIVSNDADVQMVYHKTLDLAQVVFYQPGEIRQKGATLATDIPCIVLIKGLTSEHPDIRVADPMQNKEQANLYFKNDHNSFRQTVTLPQGDRKGSSVKI